MVGRTLLQPALPITFGLKAAGWLVGAREARHNLASSRGRLAVQLGGAAGTLASLGPDGPAVVAAFADHLGLAEPVLPWHTARQRVAELAGALAVAAGTAAKISSDVALLMQAEVGEAAEPAAAGRGGSSTLPHKRNPVGAAAVGAATRRVHALVPVLFGAMAAEHERGVGGWQAEWETLTEALALTGGAVGRTAETVDGLEVHGETMGANLEATGGVLVAERIALALARRMDRAAASTAVGEAARAAVATGRSFAEALAEHPVVGGALSADELAELLDPAGYLGATGSWIERALSGGGPKEGGGG
jgi:3-carboxy-cis,cis-muconate cycloisomerase